MSYAHVSEDHKTWVRGLASRLRENGVDIQLDQWNNTLGSNLMHFMEVGLRDSDRVIAVVSDLYRQKADDREGGSGYEGQILSSEMLASQKSTRVIPIVRDNAASPFVETMPLFLKGYKALDMRDDALFEGNYESLLRDIHGRPAHLAPPVGANPFQIEPTYMTLPPHQQPAAYTSVGLNGHVDFAHSNNDGAFVIGEGEKRFTTKWSVAGLGSVYAYTDSPDIEAIALVPDTADPHWITDAASYPRNSRVRQARQGDCILWLNKVGYWAATVVRQVTIGTLPCLEFDYWITHSRTTDLSTLV